MNEEIAETVRKKKKKYGNLKKKHPFYGSMDFVWDDPSEPVPEETFTHLNLSIMVINRPLSASSIYYNPWHPSCSIHVLDSLFPQSLSEFSFVYLLGLHPPLHTPYISSPNNCLIFATHTLNIATCFAVVLRLCHLILVSQPFTWNYIL